MKGLAWAGLGVVAGAACFWPAATLETAVQQRLPVGSTVVLSGSVWKGAGHIQSSGVTWPIDWQFMPSRLLAAQLAWQLDARPAGAVATLQVAVGSSGATLRTPVFDGGIRTLHPWFPALRLLGVQGRARLDTSNFELSPATPWHAEGEGRLALSELSLAAIGGSGLGNHEFALKATGDAVSVEVVKSDGTLKLEGKGRLSNQGEYSVQGSALPLASFDHESRSRLGRFATAQSDGRFRLDARGKW